MGLRSCAYCGDKSAASLRVLVAVNIISGLCLIIFGATVEKPINSAPAVCMILLGVWNWLTALSGFLGSSRFSCCLDIFLVLDSVNTLLIFVLVGELFMNFDGLLANIDPHNTGNYDNAHVRQILRAAQWLLLLFMVVQIAALVVALLMRFFIKPDQGEATNNFEEGELAERALSMQHLRVDVEAGQSGTNTRGSKYNKLMAKMQKYQDFSRIKFTKKGWFGW